MLPVKGNNPEGREANFSINLLTITAMKKLSSLIADLFVFALVAFVTTTAQAQTYSENFDSYANRDATYIYGYAYSAAQVTNSQAISGKSVNVGPITNSIGIYETGYFYLDGSNTFSFQHKVHNMSSTPNLSVRLVDINNVAQPVLYSHTHANTAVVSPTVNFAGYEGWYKVRFTFQGTTAGSTRGILDNFTSNITQTTTGYSTRLADLNVTTSTDQATYQLGDEVHFLVNVSNIGPHTAVDGTVNVSLPNGFSVSSFTADAGLSFDQNSMVLTVSTLGSGSSATLDITSLAAAGGTYNNDAEFTTFNFMTDPVDGNNTGNNAFEVEEQILPVVFLSWDAIQNGNNVMLTWATATEVNASHYDVEVSEDGSNFNWAAKVEAAGNSVNKVAYNYSLPASGSVLYIRLKQVDNDGASIYTPTRVVNVARTTAQITVETYPNPATDRLQVRWNTESTEQPVVRVFSQQGNELSLDASTFGNSAELNVSQLPKGNYFVMVTVEGQTQKTKFLKF